MKKLVSWLVLAVIALGVPFVLVSMNSEPVVAACNPDTDTNCVSTSILPGDMDVKGMLLLIFKILVYGLGAAATVGVVIAGIQYMTARDNESQVAAAKQRLLNIVIGLVAWAVMWTVMNWLVPGGMSLSGNSGTGGGNTTANGGSNASTGGSSTGGNTSQDPSGSSGQASGNRAEGSEPATNKTGSVGSGSEGWLES